MNNKPLSCVIAARNAEIGRCEDKIARAKRHALATKSEAIRNLDYLAIRNYEDKIKELLRRNGNLNPNTAATPDRESTRQIGIGLWVW